MKTVGFIGCGNMGGALIRAAVRDVVPETVYVADSIEEKAAALSEETGAKIAAVKEIAGNCRYFFLGVKPQGMAALFDEIGEVIRNRKDRFVIITMAAGVPIERIRTLSGRSDIPVIRIMPNLPVSVGEGMIVYCPEGVTAEEQEDFLILMRHAGKLLEVKEEMIDAGTGLSGSGPGFVCYFIEALIRGGMRVGFTKEEAEALAVQTVKGTAMLLSETGRDPEELRKAVCSPHGTTLAGLSALEEGSFAKEAEDAVVRAFNRAKEL